jgi:lipopolysaccharide export LptBFGC system permease protein LptF
MGMGMALLIVLGYYVLYSIFQKFGASGIVPPLAAAWIPNATLLGLGMVLMERRQRS